MSEDPRLICPECEEHVETAEALDRRGFIRVVGERTASLLAAGAAVASAPRLLADAPPAAPAAAAAPTAKPAEALIQELYSGMTAEQKRTLVLPWDHPSRRGMFNAAINRRIGDAYTRPQQELVERILRSISSDEDGYRKITRNGTFDGSHSLQGCGANIFGDPSSGQYAWVFSGHHLTVRCDGNSEPNAAFGGPMYYGHSPHGYSQRNIFYYQTRGVLSIFDALTEAQRRQAVVIGRTNFPGEHAPSVRFRAAGQRHPGIASADLTPDQRRLVEAVMRSILSPYRREDADEVMQIVRRNGGLERIHLAFYRDQQVDDTSPWHFWRLEGPGFVWNYRVLPHVHTYVNIAAVNA
jgi:hypothetical protein